MQRREDNFRASGGGAKRAGGRRRTDIGAGSAGAGQNAAKAVVVGRVAARIARTGSVLGTIIGVDPAREGKGLRWRQGGEQGVQQKRVERGDADRGTLSKRTLPQSAHLHAYTGLF